MRWLLILLAILIGIWLWRSNRQAKPNLEQQPKNRAPDPLQMVDCAVCSVHVPTAEAIHGRQGAYCCVEHRRRAEP